MTEPESMEPESTETEQYALAEETVLEEAAPVITMEPPEENTPESPLPEKPVAEEPIVDEPVVEEPVATLETPVPASEETNEEPAVETVPSSGPISRPPTEAEEQVASSVPEDLVYLPEDPEGLEPSETYTVLPDTGGRALLPHGGSFGALLVGLGLVAAGISLRLVLLAGRSTSGAASSIEETRQQGPEG